MLVESLPKLTVFSDTITDAFWPYLLEIDPIELMKLRRRQKSFLARYGRQSMLQWDDIEVSELNAWADDLLDLMKAEGGAGDDARSE